MSHVSRGVAKARPHFAIHHTDEEWRAILSPEAYHVLRKHGTERAGTCLLEQEVRPGRFTCVGCHGALFRSETKRDDMAGWPSFAAPLPGAVETRADHSLAVARMEVHCAQCGGHLGHVFADGPAPGGVRYCVNGVALAFEPD